MLDVAVQGRHADQSVTSSLLISILLLEPQQSRYQKVHQIGGTVHSGIGKNVSSASRKAPLDQVSFPETANINSVSVYLKQSGNIRSNCGIELLRRQYTTEYQMERLYVKSCHLTSETSLDV